MGNPDRIRQFIRTGVRMGLAAAMVGGVALAPYASEVAGASPASHHRSGNENSNGNGNRNGNDNSSGDFLGGVNMDGYCRSRNLGAARLRDNTAYGWTCEQSNGIPDGVEQACRWTYGRYTPDMQATFGDFNNPNSWRCAVRR